MQSWLAWYDCTLVVPHTILVSYSLVLLWHLRNVLRYVTARLEKFIWYKCDREPWRETVTVESGRIAFEGSVY